MTPEELRELRERPEGGGYVRLTEKGKTVLEYLT